MLFKPLGSLLWNRNLFWGSKLHWCLLVLPPKELHTDRKPSNMCLTRELKRLLGIFCRANFPILSYQQLLKLIAFGFDSLEQSQFVLPPHRSIHHLRLMACLSLFQCSLQTSLFKPFIWLTNQKAYIDFFLMFVSVGIGVPQEYLACVTFLIFAFHCTRLARCACLDLFPRIYLETELTVLKLYFH